MNSLAKLILFTSVTSAGLSAAEACRAPQVMTSAQTMKTVIDAVSRTAFNDGYNSSVANSEIRTVTRVDDYHYVVTLRLEVRGQEPTDTIKYVTLKNPPPPPPNMPVPASCGSPGLMLDSVR